MGVELNTEYMFRSETSNNSLLSYIARTNTMNEWTNNSRKSDSRAIWLIFLSFRSSDSAFLFFDASIKCTYGNMFECLYSNHKSYISLKIIIKIAVVVTNETVICFCQQFSTFRLKSHSIPHLLSVHLQHSLPNNCCCISLYNDFILSLEFPLSICLCELYQLSFVSFSDEFSSFLISIPFSLHKPCMKPFFTNWIANLFFLDD